MDKKLFFALPFAALAIASCSNDDELASAPQAVPVANAPVSQAVQFFPVAQNTTRGVDATDARITDTLSTTLKLAGSAEYGSGYGYFYVQTKGYYYDKLRHDGETEGTTPDEGADVLTLRTLRRYVAYNPTTKAWTIKTINDNNNPTSVVNKLGNLYWQDDEENSTYGGNNATAKANNASFVAYAGLDQRLFAPVISYTGSFDPTTTMWQHEDVYKKVNAFDPTNGVEVTVNDIVQNQRDVAVAYYEDTQEKLKTSGVPLHFRHAMSQIVFKGQYEQDATLNEALTDDEKNIYQDLVVYVKEAVVVNAKNMGKLVGPTSSTASGQAYNADWTTWKDLKYDVDTKFYHPGWAEWTGKNYQEIGFRYTSQRANPVLLEADAQLIDNSDGKSYGPMMLMPQTMLAAGQIPATFATSAAEAEAAGAYLMLKVNIQRAAKFNGTTYYCRWYPSNSTTSGDANYSKSMRNDLKVSNLYASTNGYTGLVDVEPTSAATTPQPLTEFQDDEDAWAYIAVPVKFDWKPGYRYTFQMNFSNFAAGWFAPGITGAGGAMSSVKTIIPYGDGTNWAENNDPVIPGVHKPVTFTVTVESNWIESEAIVPQLQ